MKASSVKRDNSRKSWNFSCLVFPNLTDWELEATNRRVNTSNMMKNDPKTIFSKFGFWRIFSMIFQFEVMILIDRDLLYLEHLESQNLGLLELILPDYGLDASNLRVC